MNIQEIMGSGKELTMLQISFRALLVFLIAYGLLRISGRRSFGLHGPMDNIIVILLGAILSRAVVGASPFLPVIAGSIIIVVLHRSVGWITSKNPKFAKFAEGDKIILYENGELVIPNLKKALVCKEDIMHAMRSQLFTEEFELIDKIYMERNGEITILKKRH